MTLVGSLTELRDSHLTHFRAVTSGNPDPTTRNRYALVQYVTGARMFVRRACAVDGWGWLVSDPIRGRMVGETFVADVDPGW